MPNGLSLTYGYDNDSRITSMSYQFGSNGLGNLTYSYDGNGRRTQVGGSFERTSFPQTVTSAQYDVANELTQWNGVNITYDANGNTLNDGTATYSWNARNQLTGRGSLTFQYDGYGRRTLNAAGNNLLYQDFDATQELSGTTPIASRAVGGIDEFFTRSDSGGAYSPLTDVLGSILALVNSSGSLATQYTYEPFGNTSTAGSASSNTFQYTGRENDNDSLYFYRARYYSPSFGRFVSEDPAGFRFGPNLYQYTYDSPTNFVDPLGLWPSSGTVSIGGTINVSLGPVNWQYSGGFVIDVNGNVGVYNTYTYPYFPGGAFPSGDVSNVGNYGGSGYPYDFPQTRPGSTPVSNWFLGIGLSGAVSNAHSICSLGGPFISGSAGGGEGVTGSADGFGGTDSRGRTVVGAVARWEPDGARAQEHPSMSPTPR
jgi:RHS repeat-associated protein